MRFSGVTDSLVEYIRCQIIDGDFRPGQKLSEAGISSKLGISRSPLREAFRVLAGEHLVEIVPRHGCFVTIVSMADCKEIFETREMLECFAVDLLKEKKITKLAAVEEALKSTADLKMPADKDPAKKFRYLKIIADFHIKLVESAGNSKLSTYYLYMFPTLARYQSMYVFIDGLMDRSHHKHEEIFNKIVKGDYRSAKKMLKSHIRSWPKIVEKVVSENEMKRRQQQIATCKS
ncbi:MAG: GntR family transcriptional regulator [Desulfobacterales bacterium]|nr:GntR family transcriptional regulator [Desulfobacterales bacterium]